MSAPTPGPWIRREWTSHAPTTVGVTDPLVLTGFRIVAECERVEDARLIEAAPTLLALAQRLEPWLTAYEQEQREACQRTEDSLFLIELRSALALATECPTPNAEEAP